LKSLRKLSIFHPREWYRKRKQRKKEEMERALRQTSLRILTFIITIIGMTMGLSLIPFFPQPLPLIISFLVAFAAFMNHSRAVMPMGCLIIGLGLVYHMSRVNLISQMTPYPLVRTFVIIVIPALFFLLPVIFHRYEDTITINLGIIAATLLFFGETYFFAIPLILVTAILYKKTKLGLTVTYYIIISLPLQIMQYLIYVPTLANVRWWEDPAADPFLYVPVQGVLKSIQESMTQLRILEANKVLGTITNQIEFSGQYSELWTTQAVLARYTDSIPGILLFFMIVVGLVAAAALFTRELVTKSHTINTELILSVVTSAIVTGLFFFVLIGLQLPLAYKIQIGVLQILAGISMTCILTGFATVINYAPRTNVQIERVSKTVMEKAQELKRVRLQVIYWSLNKVKNSIPLDVSSIERKLEKNKNRLDDIIKKVQDNFYSLSELNETLNELDNDIRNEIEGLMVQLDTSLKQYQKSVYSECSAWIRKFEEIGLEVGTSIITDFQDDLSLEMRLDQIMDILETGRMFTTEVIQIAEQIYDIIQTLFDPNLPEKSLAVTFARRKLDEESDSWAALSTLFTAFHNWQNVYRDKISESIQYLEASLKSIININTQDERLLPVLGPDFSKLIDLVERSKNTMNILKKKTVNVLDIVIFREVLQDSISIAKELFLIIQKQLDSNEKAIESLLLIKDYSWESNVTFRKQLTAEIQIIIDSTKKELSKVIKKLPEALSHLDQLLRTIIEYDEKKEILLNYPIAETTIEEVLRKKKNVYAKDLPFDIKYAEEYLGLFYSQNYQDYTFDRQEMVLIKKT
jgi:hypothetical protein